MYNNACKPYQDAQAALKQRYQTIVLDYSQRDPRGIDKIIQLAFSAYDASDWDAELIVRVSHILAKYGRTEGMSLLQTQAGSLLDYYQTSILPACREYIRTHQSAHIDGQVVDSRSSAASASSSSVSSLWKPAPALDRQAAGSLLQAQKRG